MSMVKLTLRAARVNKGLTMAEAAQRLGVSPKTLWLWEHGDRLPNQKYIPAICGLYGLSYDLINFLPNNPV
nr:MAG TPA: helix-turn-helix domain protein [Bacteriophage sp.]